MSGFNFSTVTLGSAAPTGFSFGAPASNPTAGTGGFTLGSVNTPSTTTSTTSLGLGGSLFTQKPGSGFTFSTPNTGAPTTSTAAGFSLCFSKPSASAIPFSLSTPSTTSSTSGLTLGSVLTSSLPQTSSSSFFTSTPASTGLSLGSGLFPSTGLSQPSLGLALGSLGSTGVSSAPAVGASVGLGGIDFSTSSEKNDKSSGTRPEDNKALKDENLPPIICQDVDNFQRFVKEQKQLEEEISRMSCKAMLKVGHDIKGLKQLLSVSSSGLQRNALNIDKLKKETAQELKNADIALHTQKTPPGLQHENTAPSDYFRVLVEQFELQLQQYRQQIEELENHLASQSNGSHITPQDLSQAMQKLYQTFVALAAQLQSVHENVKILKHQYLGYRKAFLGDASDVFESRQATARKWQNAPHVTTGPAPFSSVPNATAVAMAATLTQQQQQQQHATAFGSGSAFGAATATGSSFGFSSASKPSGGSLSAGFGSSGTSGFSFSSPGINASAGLTFGVSNQPTGFNTGTPLLQLKKPPVGNKRGKR